MFLRTEYEIACRRYFDCKAWMIVAGERLTLDEQIELQGQIKDYGKEIDRLHLLLNPD